MSMSLRTLYAAVPLLLSLLVMPTGARAQDWCSESVRKNCGLGAMPFPGVFTGTIRVVANLTAPEYSRSVDLVITLADGRATCAGTVRDTQGTTTITGAGEVEIGMDELRRRGNAGRYEIGAMCPGQLWDEEAVFIEGETRSYHELAGEKTMEHPSTDPDNRMAGTYTVTWQLKATPPTR